MRRALSDFGFRDRSLRALLGLALGLTLGGGCGDDSTNASGTDGTTDDPSESSNTMPSSSGGTETIGETEDETEGGTEGDTETDTGDVPEDFVPAPGGMRRLMTREYRDSVELMLGVAAADAAFPPDDIAQSGFNAIGASIIPVPSDAIGVYERSAAAIADAALENPQTLATIAPCVSQQANPECYQQLAANLGKIAFRRSLSQGEIDDLAAIGLAGRDWEEGDFQTGIRYELMAILQAPSFLYIQEVGEPDPESGFRRLTPTELATRISFFLTGHTPTLELIEMAESGALDDPGQVRAQAELMVESPEARPALASFFGEALRLRGLASAAKDPEIFPTFSPELGELMADETLLLVYDIVWNRDADYTELFTADYTYVNDELAALYGMPDPGEGPLFVRTPWPAEQNRAGFLSQASFLTAQSGAARNSPTQRGTYIQERVLCSDIPAPDPDVDLNLPDDDSLTLKELLEQHMDNPGCVTCHGLTDPLGFAYEAYDAIGAYRTTDNGKPVETDGEITGLGQWDNAQELAAVLAADPRLANCLVENLIRGVLGHTPTQGEQPAIEDLEGRFESSGNRVKALLVEMASSPLFRLVDEPK